jgi:Tfp pilus assembly protein PilP
MLGQPGVQHRFQPSIVLHPFGESVADDANVLVGLKLKSRFLTAPDAGNSQTQQQGYGPKENPTHSRLLEEFPMHDMQLGGAVVRTTTSASIITVGKARRKVARE